MVGGGWRTWRQFCGGRTACARARKRRHRMNPVELTGLRADLPIGAMAAFGCLRVCQRLPELRGTKLAWAGGGGHAVLWTPAVTSREELVALLMKDVRKAEHRDELKWSEQIKTASRDEFRKNAKKALDGADRKSTRLNSSH